MCPPLPRPTPTPTPLFQYLPVGTRGHYGFVFLATNKVTGKRVAVKRIDRSLCTPYRVQEEVGLCCTSSARVCGVWHDRMRVPH